MKHIVDGMEYTTSGTRSLDCHNNYGTLVATAELSPCGDYWQFDTLIGIESGGSYTLPVGLLEGCQYCVEQQLARWVSQYAGENYYV